MEIPSLAVDVETPVMITPSQPTQHTTLFLSNIDQEAMYKVETVFFFGPNEAKNKAGESISQVVSTALANILVPYYFVAGRFRFNNAEQRLELDCNGQGVLFASAKCSLQLSDLGDVSVPNPAYRNLILQPDESLGLFEAPIATFQVTSFACGGFTFGLTIFHSLMDGVSVTAFLRNLGSVARGEGLIVTPNPSREFLRARNPTRPDYYEQSMCKLLNVAKFSDIPLLPFNPTLSNINNVLLQTHVFKVFPFSQQMLLSLKDRALEDGIIKRCSSFEAITALVLKEVYRARNLDPEQVVNMFVAVDFSRKLPAPENFCGNAIVTACITAKAGELCSKSLGHFTGKVQEALNDVNGEYVRSWTDFWELHRIGPARLPVGGCISGWWKLPFYELDFGWGRPIYAGPVPNQLVGFVVLLSNGKNDGGANIYLSLEPHEMAAFESNIYSVFDKANK